MNGLDPFAKMREWTEPQFELFYESMKEAAAERKRAYDRGKYNGKTG